MQKKSLFYIGITLIVLMGGTISYCSWVEEDEMPTPQVQLAADETLPEAGSGYEECVVEALVVDPNKVTDEPMSDGCDLMLQLVDGQLLQPVAFREFEYRYVIREGMQLMIGYIPSDDVINDCQRGKPVEIVCARPYLNDQCLYPVKVQTANEHGQESSCKYLLIMEDGTKLNPVEYKSSEYEDLLGTVTECFIGYNNEEGTYACEGKPIKVTCVEVGRLVR